MNKDFSWLSMDSTALNNFLVPLAPALDTGFHLKKKDLTYAWFDSNNVAQSSDYGVSSLHTGEPVIFEPKQYHRDTVKAQLEYLSRIIDLKFSEVETNGDFEFGLSNLVPGGYGSLPGGAVVNFVDYKSAFFTSIFAHEFGHNMGLEHAADYFQNPSQRVQVPLQVDSTLLSVMSYEYPLKNAFSFGVLDFKKLIEIYGVSTSTQGINFKFKQANPFIKQFEINQTNVDKFNVEEVHGYQKINGNELTTIIDDSISMQTTIGTRGVDSVDLSSLSSAQGSTLTNLSAGVFSLKPNTNKDAYYDFSSQKFVDFNYGQNVSQPTIKFYEGGPGTGLSLEKLTLTNQKDKVFLGEIFDEINTGKGDDEFNGFGDHKKLIGGEGADLWSTGVSKSSAIIGKTQAGNSLSSSDKTIEFEGIERIQFTDSKVAFDLNGNAGKVAKIIGAVFGQELVKNKEYVGVGLNFLDSGTSYEQLIKIALDFRFGKTPSNTELVKTLYSNVAGNPPPIQEERDYVSLLNNGTFNQTSLTLFAAEHELNAQRIDLVGLTNNGIEYM